MVGPLFPDYNLGIDGYTDMAATMERLEEYRTHNTQFCKRMLDFFTVMFPAQVSSLLENTDGISTRDGKPEIVAHAELESYLGRYCGLMLYLKEILYQVLDRNNVYDCVILLFDDCELNNLPDMVIQ